MRSLGILALVMLVTVVPLAPAQGTVAPGASDVVLERFDALEIATRSLGLAPGPTVALAAKLDAARHAASEGAFRAALNSLDSLRSALDRLGAPPLLLADLSVLREMVVFEMLFGPIPEAAGDRMPYPVQVDLLRATLAGLVLEAPRAIAEECVSQIFPLPPVSPFAPGGPQGPPQDPQLDEQAMKEFKQAAKEVLTDVKKAVTGGSSGDAKPANTTVRPRCEVDRSKIVNASASGSVTVSDLTSAVTSLGVQFTRSFNLGDFKGSATGGIDVLDPFGTRGWRFSGSLELGGDTWGASLGTFYDSEGGFGVSGGFRIRF